MKQIDLEAFKESCQKKRCLRNTMITPQCPKDYKQEQCYNKYIQKQEKDKVKQEAKNAEHKAEIDEYKRKKESGEKIEYVDNDPEWTELKKKIIIRDNGTCRFFSIMTEEEKKLIRPHLWGDFKKIDGAHCIARSQSKNLYYEVRNVHSLYRLIHSCLDNMINPFTQKPMTKEEHDAMWIRVIGIEEWNWLQENK